MNSDPTIYILATAIVSTAIGFMACAVFASNRIRRSEIEGWKAGVKFYQEREQDARETPRL